MILLKFPLNELIPIFVTLLHNVSPSKLKWHHLPSFALTLGTLHIYLEAVLIRHELLSLFLVDGLCRAPCRLGGQGSSTGTVWALCQVKVCDLDTDLVTDNVLELQGEKALVFCKKKNNYFNNYLEFAVERINNISPAGRCFGWVCPLWRQYKHGWWTFLSVSPHTGRLPYFHPANS